MRILFVGSGPHEFGGVARSATRFREMAEDAGHELYSVYPDTALFYGDVRRHEEKRITCFHPGALLELQCWERCAREDARLFRPDVIVGFYGTRAGYVATLVAEQMRLPSVVALRGNDFDRDRFRPDRQALVAHAMAKATAITTVSQAMAESVRASGFTNVHFVTNSVDPKRFKPLFIEARDVSRRTLGIFGHIKPKRGVRQLFECGAHELFDVHVFGSVDRRSEGEIPDCVTLHEYRNDLAWLLRAYASCDIVAQPSLFDGMPNVVLEAMACARVILGANVAGIPDLIRHGENGFLFRNRDELSHLLGELQHRELDSIGQAARESVPTPKEEWAEWNKVLQTVL